MSSPSRSVASSLAESDSIPAFNPPQAGGVPPSGASKRPGVSLLPLSRVKGLTDSPGGSPASASKVHDQQTDRTSGLQCFLGAKL